MSHLSTIQTEIRDLDCVRAACAYLQIPILPGEVEIYRADKSALNVPIAFGRPACHAGERVKRAMGLFTNGNGKYDFLGDVWYARQRDASTLHKLGVTYGSDAPTLLLQEYALQVGLLLAAQHGLHAERQAADPELDHVQSGAQKLILTGGYLPPHLSMHLIACADGTSRVRFDGGVDQSCYLYTRPLEDALGVLLGDIGTLDTVHQGQMHLERSLA